MVVQIPNNVLDLMNRPDSVKVLATACKCAIPHAIVCGSIFSPEPTKVAVGEVLMKVSSANMKENDRASILVTKGPEAYLIKGRVNGRQDNGPILDGLNKNLEKANLKARAVWIFDVLEVFDEGAGPNAGKKLA